MDAVAPEAGTVGTVDADELRRWSDALAARAPAEVLAAAAKRWPAIRFGTGFGPEGCVLVDLIARHRLPVDIFTLDTGLLFPETYALWRRLRGALRPGHPRRAAGPDRRRSRPRSSASGCGSATPTGAARCARSSRCAAALAGSSAWITTIRRDQTADRATARVVEWDERFGLVKVNPLAHWTSADVRAYVRAHDVPINPLHERGYPSIGCMPCTTPVAAGESARAGRWRGQGEDRVRPARRRPLAPPSVLAPTEGADAHDAAGSSRSS